MTDFHRCPISYELIPVSQKYSTVGLKLLSPRLSELHDLPFTMSELRSEAAQRAGKMSIQGVQPKVSALLNIVNNQFEIVDINGHYILKPPSEHYPELPQNEDLTMHLASMIGIEIPLHGMVYAKDGSLTYFIRRFDRIGKKNRLNVEDFAQLSQHNRDTKYRSSMEKIASIINENCTFPQVEKQKLFLRTLFNFLIGNEDMHLKNFSLITRDNIITLSPAYDLLNTTIAIGNAKEEIALPLKGKKNNLNSKDFIIYLGQEKLELTPISIEKTLNSIKAQLSSWQELIHNSFLSKPMQEKYEALLLERASVLFK
ncbi:MAG: HipA domain-containing protein [Gammaproteobacteria bacterium]|nr:HipA domain-containing protein [Gammaproteobacteria bacterium]